MHNVPPRTQTAPLKPGAGGVVGVGQSRFGAPPHVSNLPSRGRRGPPSVDGPAAGRAPEACAPVRTESPKPQPSPAAASGASGPVDMMEDFYPEDCVYEIDQFMRLRHFDRAPPGVTQYALQLWRERPELQNELSDNSSMRENLFRDNNATMPSKVLTERKLHNEVLGILGKVTEANMEVMKVELKNLPIRQSTEEEIREVIMVFFNKSTRQEESRYAPLYVELVRHLISAMGEGEPASRMIRKEIISQCQSTFMEGFDGAARLNEEIAKLSEEDALIARTKFTGKQKANIRFLGLLFKAHLVAPRVVRTVLDNLIYGDGKRRHTPTDYNVTHFMDLLLTCGPELDPSWKEDPLPRYEATLVELSRSHPQMRIRFLLENFVETMHNDWVPLHGPGSKAPARRPARPVVRPVVSAAPEPKMIDQAEFGRLVENYFASSSVDEIVKVMGEMPGQSSLAYCTHLLKRYIVTTRYGKERARLGEFFKDLIARQAITAENAQVALLRQAQLVISEDLVADAPRYFEQWSEVIKNGLEVFPVSMHTEMLNLLVDAHARKSLVQKMVIDVCGQMEETRDKDYNPNSRFRALQALLRYTPPLLADDEDEFEEEDASADDIVEVIGAEDVDVEISMFYTLGENFNEKSSVVLNYVTDALKKPGNNAFPLLSAMFTFVRYDVDNLCTVYKDTFKKLFSQRPTPALLEEVYVQWKSLKCPEKMFLSFIKKLIALGVVVPKDNIDKLKDRLRVHYGAEPMVVKLEQELNSKN